MAILAVPKGTGGTPIPRKSEHSPVGASHRLFKAPLHPVNFIESIRRYIQTNFDLIFLDQRFVLAQPNFLYFYCVRLLCRCWRALLVSLSPPIISVCHQFSRADHKGYLAINSQRRDLVRTVIGHLFSLCGPDDDGLPAGLHPPLFAA